MPSVRLADGDLNYQLEGPEGAPVLILSNSLGTHLAMWDDQAAAFSERFRLLRRMHEHGNSLETPVVTAPPW